jgi:hypothetical protein
MVFAVRGLFFYGEALRTDLSRMSSGPPRNALGGQLSDRQAVSMAAEKLRRLFPESILPAAQLTSMGAGA